LDKIIEKLCEWDPVNDAAVFPLSGGLLSFSLLGCLPREQLGVSRQPWGLIIQWRDFLHFMETLSLALGIKQFSRAFHPTKCKLLFTFQLRLLLAEYFGLF